VSVMPAIFVNGNPETAAVWGPLLAELGRADAVTLSPPGFGAPVPGDFGATADEYLEWLIGQLEAIGGPIDLVGHDWGAMHALRVACARPDLLRSWCTDTAGSFAFDYVWHEATHAWQTPGAGEQAVAGLLDMEPADRATFYESLGMTPPVAEQLAAAFDETMGRCILALYRSVPQPVLSEWSAEIAAARARPGLVVIPTDDIYSGGEARHRWVADRTGAQVVVLQGLGHWWLLQDPVAGATALRRFWDAL
jgi:pimeloyl-ACP methyl ester carboxylesterase